MFRLRGETFKDRLRARRERMKETSSLLSDGSDLDISTRPHASDDTWVCYLSHMHSLFVILYPSVRLEITMGGRYILINVFFVIF